MEKTDDLDRGNILVHTGEGKGKTTSAIGQIVRAVGHGLNAKLITFFKGNEGRFERGTFNVLRELDVPITNFAVEHPDFGRSSAGETTRECDEALEYIGEFFDSEGREYDLLVLDEVNVALETGYLDVDQFLDLLDDKPHRLEVVCTGRGAPEGLVEKADLVSRIENVKHFYDRGVVTRAGYEY
ncbi:MAG: cob(I)yrinic acid a,c-diamide adenosyltransferase [Candidatus Bipolaricaulota bacterium]